MMVDVVAERGSGEQKLRESRRRSRRLVWTGLAIGLVAGLVGGIVVGYSRAAQDAGHVGVGWLAWPVLAVTLAVFSWYTWTYFRQVDELDLLDNLWASTVGLYAFVIAYPGWQLLHMLDQAPPPDTQTLWWSALAAAAAAYCWRKLRHRF